MTITPSKKTFKQASIRKALQENPDLSREFISNILKARQEARTGNLKPYIFGNKPTREPFVLY